MIQTTGDEVVGQGRLKLPRKPVVFKPSPAGRYVSNGIERHHGLHGGADSQAARVAWLVTLRPAERGGGQIIGDNIAGGVPELQDALPQLSRRYGGGERESLGIAPCLVLHEEKCLVLE